MSGPGRRNVPLGIQVIRACTPSFPHRVRAYKASVVVLTFFAYMTYHMSRKAISVVKTVWYPDACKDLLNTTGHCPSMGQCGGNDSAVNTTNGECNFWEPFHNDSVLGDLDLTFLLGYAFAMFASGHIADRVNLRYFLFVGMLLTGIFTGLLGLASFAGIHSIAFFVVIQFIGGVAQSSGWPAVVAVMANWFGLGNRGFILGLWNSHTSFGNIFGAIIPGVWVKGQWGWSFIVPGIIVAGMGIIILLFLVVEPEDVDCPPPTHHVSDEDDKKAVAPTAATQLLTSTAGEGKVNGGDSEAVGFIGALKIPGVIEYSLCLFFSKFMNYIFLYWLPVYVHAVCVDGEYLTPQRSAFYSSLFDLGGIVGGVILGIVSDRTGARGTSSFVMLILGIPALYLFHAFGKQSLAALLSLMTLTGLLLNGPYALITTAVAADLGTHETLRGSKKAKATVAAIIDGTGSIGKSIECTMKQTNTQFSHKIHIVLNFEAQ